VSKGNPRAAKQYCVSSMCKNAECDCLNHETGHEDAEWGDSCCICDCYDEKGEKDE
jgi:hypothetical protein